MTQSKLCKNCDHFSTRHYGYYCAHPILGVSEVSGYPEVLMCHNARGDKYTYNDKYGFCRNGVHFLAKRRWWQKLFTRAKPQ